MCRGCFVRHLDEWITSKEFSVSGESLHYGDRHSVFQPMTIEEGKKIYLEVIAEKNDYDHEILPKFNFAWTYFKKENLVTYEGHCGVCGKENDGKYCERDAKLIKKAIDRLICVREQFVQDVNELPYRPSKVSNFDSLTLQAYVPNPKFVAANRFEIANEMKFDPIEF